MPGILGVTLPERFRETVPPFVTEITVGIVTAIALLLMRLALQPVLGDRAPYAFVFVGVAAASIAAGWRCGLATLVGGQVLIWYAVLEPQWSFVPKDTGDVAALVVVTASQVVLLAVIAIYQREIRNAWDARDATDRARDLLVEELNHRVKNTLSVVQSLARHSLRGVEEAPVEAFTSRLMALARTHDLLATRQWEWSDISMVVDAATAPYRVKAQNRFTVTGPNIDLPPRTALNLALTLNELATNAAKFGALTSQQGHVTIQWTLSSNTMLLAWKEMGGPQPVPPKSEGFGLRMIRQAIADEPNGTVELNFEPTGLVCWMEMELA